MESDNSEEASKTFCILCGPSILSSEASQEDVISEKTLNKEPIVLGSALRKLLQKSSTTSITLEDDREDGITGGDNVYLCDECNGITVKALESRSRVEHLETDVRQLQKQLLELLKRLQGEMDVWNHEMCKIEEKVYKRSNSTVGESTLSSSKFQDKAMAEVRCRIIEMMTDLRLHQSNMEDKLILLSRMEKGEDNPDPLEEDRDQFTQETCFSENQDSEEIITCDASLSNEESAEEGDAANTTSNYFVGHVIGIGGEMGEEQDDSTLFSTLLYGDHSPNKEKSPTRSISNQSHRKNGKVKRLPKFKSVNLARMCSFKKGLIKRAMERESKRKLYDDHHDNPLIKYFLRYDPSYDTFFVGGVQIRLRSDQESVLDCMGVGCTMSWTPPQQANNEHTTTFDRDIRNHVIGKHLGGFTCRVCGIILDSYFKLMSHFKKQHPGQKPLNDLGAEKGKASQNSPAASQAGHLHATRLQKLDRFRRKVTKFPGGCGATSDQMSESVPSPSEGLKQVRITMRSAIESLGSSDQGTSAGRSAEAWEPPKKKSKRSNSKVNGVEGQSSIHFGGEGVTTAKGRKTRGKKKR